MLSLGREGLTGSRRAVGYLMQTGILSGQFTGAFLYWDGRGPVFCLGKWHFRWATRVHYAFYEAVKRLHTVGPRSVKEGTHKRGMSFPNWIDDDDDLGPFTFRRAVLANGFSTSSNAIREPIY